MKKILIIFPDHWFSYSPTVTNIFELLAEQFEVLVIAEELLINGKPACERYEDPRVIYVKFPEIPKLIWRVLNIIELVFNKFVGRSSNRISFFRIIQTIILYLKCRKMTADEVIGVDAVGFLVAQRIFKKAHLVSLEITTDELFYQQLVKKASQIKSILIQSADRLRLLNLPLQEEQKTFIVQNAPIFVDSMTKKNFNAEMVYFGSGNLAMGIRYLFEYFTQYQQYSLTFKGLFDLNYISQHFPSVQHQRNIKFDDSYVSNENIQDYLNRFSIGFCFYDFDYVGKSSKQNMLHGPAGKVFNYFASGLPIIASDIPGFQMIKDYNAGILLKDPSPKNIDNAIEQIRANYKDYSENSKRAAKNFCFRKSFSPFIQNLKS
jgi:glycosyltransferase involved in cell wall biosynthesis